MFANKLQTLPVVPANCWNVLKHIRDLQSYSYCTAIKCTVAYRIIISEGVKLSFLGSNFCQHNIGECYLINEPQDNDNNYIFSRF